MYIQKKQLQSHIPLRRALLQFVGMGEFLANQLCDQLGFRKNLCLKDLHYNQRDRFSRIFKNYYLFEAELRQENKKAIRRLVRIKTYRGLRLRDGLPVRGQRTHTNANTSRKLNRKRVE